MNERIKELALQANAHETGHAYYRGEKKPENAVTLHSVDLEKFAELIIQDAVNQLRQEWYDLNNSPEIKDESPRDIGLRVGQKTGVMKSIHIINKHFGINNDSNRE